MIKKSALALCGVALMALSASAQNAQLKSAHGTFTHVDVRVETKLPPSNITIFKNFGTNPAEVWQANGWLILGPTSPSFGATQSIGQPFTTGSSCGASCHAKKAEVPVQYYNLGDGGTAGFEASIYTDAAGLPGTSLGTKNIPAAMVPTFPVCCTTADAVTVPFPGAGIALAGSTPYWLVIDANNAANTATEDVWCFNETTDYAYNLGSGWNGPVGASQAPAATITGTNP